MLSASVAKGYEFPFHGGFASRTDVVSCFSVHRGIEHPDLRYTHAQTVAQKSLFHFKRNRGQKRSVLFRQLHVLTHLFSVLASKPQYGLPELRLACRPLLWMDCFSFRFPYPGYSVWLCLPQQLHHAPQQFRPHFLIQINAAVSNVECDSTFLNIQRRLWRWQFRECNCLAGCRIFPADARQALSHW